MVNCNPNGYKIGAFEDNIFQLITHDLTPLFSVGSGFCGVRTWVAATYVPKGPNFPNVLTRLPTLVPGTFFDEHEI